MPRHSPRTEQFLLREAINLLCKEELDIWDSL